jgi:hypothetical protein
MISVFCREPGPLVLCTPLSTEERGEVTYVALFPEGAANHRLWHRHIRKTKAILDALFLQSNRTRHELLKQ